MLKDIASLFRDCAIAQEGGKWLVDPGILTTAEYKTFKKAIENIEGSYENGKKRFVFHHDPTKRINEIIQLNQMPQRKLNDWFATPKEVVEIMLNIMVPDFNEDFRGYDILEPSAGRGDIIKHIINLAPKMKKANWTAVECDEANLEYLNKFQKQSAPEMNVYHEDFLQWETDQTFDLIFMNPPFSSNHPFDYQRHIVKASSLLRPSGTLIAVIPQIYHPKEGYVRSFPKTAIPEFVDGSLSPHFHSLPAKAFQESKTLVKTQLMVVLGS